MCENPRGRCTGIFMVRAVLHKGPRTAGGGSCGRTVSHMRIRFGLGPSCSHSRPLSGRKHWEYQRNSRLLYDAFRPSPPLCKSPCVCLCRRHLECSSLRRNIQKVLQCTLRRAGIRFRYTIWFEIVYQESPCTARVSGFLAVFVVYDFLALQKIVYHENPCVVRVYVFWYTQYIFFLIYAYRK